MIYVRSAPVLVDSNVFWIFVVTMLLNTKSPCIVTKQLVFFLATELWTTCYMNFFLNGARAQFFHQIKYRGMLLNASLKHDSDIQRQVKSPYCVANKLRDTFDQCSPAVKQHYFVHIACQCMLATCGANTHRLFYEGFTRCIQ